MALWEQYNLMKNGFTLIELLVVVAIIGVLSGVILFSVTQYVNKGKDSNIAGNLSVLIPAGEAFYNANGSYGYQDFCDPSVNPVIRNVLSQMPENSEGPCYSASVTATSNPQGVCCRINVNNDAWAACAQKFTDENKAYCVDSRGVKGEVDISKCNGSATECDI